MTSKVLNGFTPEYFSYKVGNMHKNPKFTGTVAIEQGTRGIPEVKLENINGALGVDGNIVLKKDYALTNNDFLLKTDYKLEFPRSFESMAEMGPGGEQFTRVCFSPYYGEFCVLGQHHGYMTSDHGKQFTRTTGFSERHDWSCLIWAAEIKLFCAVARARAMVSSNGLVWNMYDVPEEHPWSSMAWSPTLQMFVVVSTDGAAMKSGDGMSWEMIWGFPGGEWTSVCWASTPACFYVVKRSGAGLISSLNGTDWVAVSYNYSGNKPFGGTDLVWSEELGKLIIGGGGYCLSAKYSAINAYGFGEIQNMPKDAVSFRGVWSPETMQYVAVADGKNFYYSRNAVSANTYLFEHPEEPDNLVDIAWGSYYEDVRGFQEGFFMVVGRRGFYPVLVRQHGVALFNADRYFNFSDIGDGGYKGFFYLKFKEYNFGVGVIWRCYDSNDDLVDLRGVMTGIGQRCRLLIVENVGNYYGAQCPQHLIECDESAGVYFSINRIYHGYDDFNGGRTDYVYTVMRTVDFHLTTSYTTHGLYLLDSSKDYGGATTALNSTITVNSNNIASLQTTLNELIAAGENKTGDRLTVIKSDKDVNNVFRLQNYYRYDGTLFASHEFVEGTSPFYTKKEIKEYSDDGAVVKETIWYEFEYNDSNEITAENIALDVVGAYLGTGAYGADIHSSVYLGVLYLSSKLAGTVIADFAEGETLSCSYSGGVSVMPGVVRVGDRAFKGVSLETVTVSETVEELGVEAFEGCGCTTLVFSGDALLSVGDRCFYGGAFGTLVLPDSVTTLGVSAFEAGAIHKLVVGSSVSSVGAGCFDANVITQVQFNGAGCPELDIGGNLKALYDANGAGLYEGTQGASDWVFLGV
jgi:hypothetical protein